MSEADRPGNGEPIPFPLSPTEAPAPESFSPEMPFSVLASGTMEHPAPVRQFPAWSIFDAMAVLGVTALSIVMCSVVALGIAHSLPRYRHMAAIDLAQLPLVIIGSQIAAYPIVIVLMAMVVRSKSGERFLPAIHWNWPLRRSTWFFASGFVLAFAVQGLAQLLPIPKSLPMDKFFNDAFSAYLMAFFGILFAPLLEELFFRGMLYPVLRRQLGLFTSVALTSAAFAAIHGAQLGYAWAPLLSIFLVGVALTLVREYSNSVAASVLVHSGYNLTLFGVLWWGTDHFRHLDKLGS